MKIQVLIKNEAGDVTNKGLFQSVEEAEGWATSNASAFPDPHTVEQTDVTAEYEAAEADLAAIARGRAKQEVGADAIAMLNHVHEEMNLDMAGLAALAANQQLMLAVTFVRNGAIKIGRDIFLAAGAAHYTPEQLARITKPIDQSGLID